MVWTRLEIDLDALSHNFKVLRDCLPSSTKMMPIVKSDAYGHGMLQVAKRLSREGAEYFGVSKLSEASELRSGGITAEILILLGIDPDEAEGALETNVIVTLYRQDVARCLSKRALSGGKTARVHVKIDTGMNRLGVPYREAPEFLSALKSLPGLHVCGLFSHFAVADEGSEQEMAFTRKQLERFLKVVDFANDLGLPIKHLHMANSAAVIDFKRAHLQLVRPGVALYGGYPSSRFFKSVELKPVMTLKTKIIMVKTIPEGESIGYGRTYTTQRRSRIATIPIGYDDGYSRLFSSNAEVLVRGRRVPVVGRVSMNLVTLDVTGVPNVVPGDEVVLLGRQGDEVITAEELAVRRNTINYEVFCNLGSLKPKVFVPVCR